MTEINKEIEEMARIMCGHKRTCQDCLRECTRFGFAFHCECLSFAEKVYKKGYRKEKEVKAETAKWDMLCNRLGNIIANGDDCENNCCQGFLDMVNEIKHYDGEYERQLTAETVKEFAEKVIDRVFEGITQRFCDCYNDGLSGEEPDKRLCENYLNAFNECKKIARKEIIKLAEQYGKEEVTL